MGTLVKSFKPGWMVDVFHVQGRLLEIALQLVVFLGGGFKYVLFSSLLGEDSYFD